MRIPITLLTLVFAFAATATRAQYPATTGSDAGWGGYAVQAPVPYQPTLEGPPVVVMPQDGSAMWQSPPPVIDPNSQAVMLDGTAPIAAPVQIPGNVPADPGYSITQEPDLKKSLIPMGSRDGFFQKVKFTATWLPQPNSDSLGFTDLRTEVVTALPFFTRENPIIITPSYEMHLVESPATLPEPLPSKLNDIAMDFHIFRVYDNHWIADFAVTPGIFADDHSFDSSEALRINGRAIGVYAPTIDLKYALGVTYLDGGWAKVVPVVGFIYTPTDDVEYQILFPTPRISWRLPWTNCPGQDERWFYIGLEYGNQAWAIQDSNGTEDVLASRDYRAIMGWERRIAGGVSHRLEIGYVFNRDIKVASISGNDIPMDSTLLLRAGISY
jgi:hypothetical protein